LAATQRHGLSASDSETQQLLKMRAPARHDRS
jgi:hypothetical protein